ncbi:MAG: UvrD-helicase domain-containing protein [Terricaulis sp.]
MDAVELARQVAATLHLNAVASGNDPWQLYAFAIAEAKRLDVDVETATCGAAILNKARAVYLPKDRLILHENVEAEFDRAFLVAHELGHIVLGDDVESAPCSIEPGRAAEASPTGFDRVVDYGRRQRREVQMDLFAREFLIPRAIVRKLHVDEGLSASAIADRFGAPFEVVAQQMFDAMLLPEIFPQSEAPAISRVSNPLQQAAVDHNGQAYLLEAGPGTGKTQTLTARAERVLAEGVDPRRMLLLTFSNKAAGEMAERIARSNKDAAAAMWIGTFHAFGLDIVRRFHSELGLAHDPRLMDRTEAVELLDREFPRLGLRHYRNIYDPTQIIADMLAAISRAKDELVGAPEYAELADAMAANARDEDARQEAERAIEVGRVYAAYEKLKGDALAIDFGDLVMLPVTLLENDPAIRAHLQSLYDHVLVDEYQDVNRSSVRLLSALRGGGENLWAVGDVKQSIYRFRGASSFNMARFGREDFPSGVRGRLKRNYRSTPEIVDAFSTFALRMRVGDAESGLEADCASNGNAVEVRTADRAEQQTVAIADAIEELRGAGYAYRNQAVLCTSNEKLARLAQDLERLGVPVLFLGSLFEREEIKDLLALLSVLTDRRAMGIVRVACWPEFAMSIADVAAIGEHMRAEARSPGYLLLTGDQIEAVSSEGRQALEALRTALSGFDKTSSPWNVLATVLLDRTRIVARLAASGDIVDRTRAIAIWQFLNFVRSQPRGRGLPVTRLLDRVRRLVRLADDRDFRQMPLAAQGIDAVRLSTIHGAKGLEFPVVHVPGMNQGTLPRTPPRPTCPAPDGMIQGGTGDALGIFRDGQADEQECIFFVALSRARDRLIVYAPTHNVSGANRPLSQFLERLGTQVSRRHVVPSRDLPPSPDTNDIELEIEGPMSFSAHQLGLYDSCPRRFLYTHLLQIGGRRRVTAFMEMHEAARTVFQELVQGDASMLDDADLVRRVDEACAAQGLTEEGYDREYRTLAVSMVRYFVSVRQGHTPEVPSALSLDFGGELVIVVPDDVLIGTDGRRKVRRVRTGHHRGYESDDVGAAAFLLAARKAFPGADVELVHLSDEQVRPLDFTPTKLRNREASLRGLLGDIRAGRFPAVPSTRTCPSCPAFFICGPTPPGVLRKKF